VLAPEPRAQLAWNPGLANANVTLGDVYRDMPRSDASQVPWVVRALENPRSPIALPGAVDLLSHDCIHALLGRGLLPQDEAFVLGFTMGTMPSCRRWHAELFKNCARRLYSGAYRFDAIDAQVFDFALEAAQASGAMPLAGVDFRRLFARSLGDLRRELKISVAALVRVYERERARWPGTRASTRLPGSRCGSSVFRSSTERRHCP